MMVKRQLEGYGPWATADARGVRQATTLVGIITGIPIGMTLFCAGVGTLLFHLVTGGKGAYFLGFQLCLPRGICCYRT